MWFQLFIYSIKLFYRICTSRTGIKFDQIGTDGPDVILIESNYSSGNHNYPNINVELQTYKDALRKVVIQVIYCVIASAKLLILINAYLHNI